MQLCLYTDVHAFYEDIYAVLMRSEAQNMIPLGNLLVGHTGNDKTGWRDPKHWFMATITDAEGIRLTAIMTPPHNLTLYATDNIINPKAIHCLIDGCKDLEIPGVTTEKALAECFANEYTKRRATSVQTTMRQRMYELTAVNPNIPNIGNVRLLEEKDMPFFPYWVEGFYAARHYGKTKMCIPRDAHSYLKQIAAKKLYLLEDHGIPVSMAGYTRELQTVVGVAFVYTPPYQRGKGYATCLVAQISQLALNKGFARCYIPTWQIPPPTASIKR